MNLFWAITLLVSGLLLLWKSADLLVDGAVGLAKKLGISSLVIGLTVVAMGTSTPEIAASIAAAVRGAGDIAVGNIYGSNIANLALVGGVIAFIRPITIRKRTLRCEMPVMLAVGLLLWPLLRNLQLSRLEGLFLLTVFAILIALTAILAIKDTKIVSEPTDKNQLNEIETKTAKLNKCLLLVILGLAGLAVGADITVRGAVVIGERAGLSETVIGQTIIAFGTSLPELVTCVVAAVKKQDDISIGNLVGSNIFNTLLVSGAASVIRPFEIVARLAGTDYWIMISVSAGFILLTAAGRRVIGRLAGTLLVCTYVGYIAYQLIYSR